MGRVESVVEWFTDEWLALLIWFSVGVFVLPITLSIFTSWIQLDRFYGGLFSATVDLQWLVLAVTPYLGYLFYRFVRALRGTCSCDPQR